MSFLQQSTAQQIQARMATSFASAATSAGIPVANLGPGGSLGAVFNAITAESIDLQGQIAYATAMTRLQSSASQIPGVNSPDVDSFYAQFGTAFSREQAVAGTTTVVFSSPSPAPSGGLVIAAGTTVQAAPNTQFIVIADATQSGWNAGLNAYVIAAGATTVSATVQAVAAGISGNVQAATITQILSLPNAPAPVGVNGVTNPQAVTNGSPQESDAASIARFQTWFSGRWANPQGVFAAVAGAQGGLTFQIGDMLDQYGDVVPNFLSVIVNVAGQNSGPSQTVLSTINAAVLANRPLGMPYTVVSPIIKTLAIVGTIVVNPNAVAATVIQNASNAVAAYLNGIGLINAVFTDPTDATTIAKYAEISSVILATPGVSNILPGWTLAGGTIDVTAPFGTQLVCGNITLSASS
jgi:hypothetical protein